MQVANRLRQVGPVVARGAPLGRRRLISPPGFCAFGLRFDQSCFNVFIIIMYFHSSFGEVLKGVCFAREMHEHGAPTAPTVEMQSGERESLLGSRPIVFRVVRISLLEKKNSFSR